jgi:hypothetical protein
VFFRVHDNGRHLRLAVNDPAKTTDHHELDGRNVKQTSLDSTARGLQGLPINRMNVRGLDACSKGRCVSRASAHKI